MSFDRNQGMTVRFHPKGMRIGMYKSNPGVFVDGQGNQVETGVARQAGFDVDALEKERKKWERLDAERERIESEFADAERKIESDHEVFHVGNGKWSVRDADGNRLIDPTSKEEAEAKAEELSG